jgi:RNA polymerase sigma factor (sigma-70 family)
MISIPDVEHTRSVLPTPRPAHELTPDEYAKVYVSTEGQLRATMFRRYNLSADECDDILQQAWCLLLEKREEVRDTGAWLSGTVMNLSRQLIHRATRERPFDAFPASERSYTHDSAVTLAVRRALSRLDERSRLLCELIGLEQLSYAEVSERLSIPIGSIGPLYMRAKERLRKELTN